MLDIKFIRENQSLVEENCRARLNDCDINRLLLLDKERRKILTNIETIRSQSNELSSQGGVPSEDAVVQGRKLKEEEKKLGEELVPVEKELKELWMKVPNMTHPDVKISADENDNTVLEQVGEPTKFNFAPKDHVALAEDLDLIDFDRATKVSGAKFYYLKNELALMEFALIQYALDITTKHGFIPFSTPDLAKREVLEGVGFNPRGESTQIYNIENSDLSLIATAEITMGGYHMDEVLDEKDLPKKYVAVSHCFRTEAGSYSKFSKGTFRVHQFTKVEMFQYTLPLESEIAHQEILDIEKEIFKGLEIPFRVVDHCTADLGAPSIRTYDLEAWMPGKANKENGAGDWGEVTSTSNCTNYQSRGLSIRYKTGDGRKEFVHMLNGTAIAISRAIIAILENHQQEDGSVKIPEVLQRYMSGRKEIKKIIN
ncbi:MAG: serine--tRNA ligase [Patescibacteria group bacterium]|nr:serine--tRNA ligase [Patescibacteria group bacterium]